jgi:hypothetical protein
VISRDFSAGETRPPFDVWLDALEARYAGSMTRPELLKAIRALSWRYVEARTRLDRGAAFGSAGKRAAFAMFYAPLHFLTAREIVRALGVSQRPVRRLVDLGCGTGVSSAAWALEQSGGTSLSGVDAHPWAVAEAAWTWRTLGLDGRARRGDLVGALEGLGDRDGRRRPEIPGVMLGWSVNELDRASRPRAAEALFQHIRRGGSALVIEPLAKAITPWWDEWSDRVRRLDGRADEWMFDVALPARLQDLNDAAGFGERRLTARTLWYPGK